MSNVELHFGEITVTVTEQQLDDVSRPTKDTAMLLAHCLNWSVAHNLSNAVLTLIYSIRNQRQNGFSRRDVYLLKELCLLQHFGELPANLLDQMNRSSGKCVDKHHQSLTVCYFQLKLALARFCCRFLNCRRSTVSSSSRCYSAQFQPR